MAVQAGYIYVLENDCMPGIVKIGVSVNVERRVNELWTTGVPSPFRAFYEQYVDDPYSIEKIVHTRLRRLRVSDKREFFHIAPRNAVNVIRFVIGQQCDYWEDMLPADGFEEARVW